MLAKIDARNGWGQELRDRFGESGSIVELPDSTVEFLQLLEPGGRFEWEPPTEKEPYHKIEFHNGYD